MNILFSLTRFSKSALNRDIGLLPIQGKEEVKALLTTRFWLHAYCYSQILSLILLAVLGEGGDQLFVILKTLAVGSASYAFFQLFVGAIVQKLGAYRTL